MSREFKKLLTASWEQKKFLCVGLDPDYEKIPESVRNGSIRESIVAFNRAIVDATKDIVGAYKPNSAFYELHGDEGWGALRETIQYIRDQAPEIPVILDSKRGDIGNTNEYYARSAFDHLRADAITLHPYTGAEGLAAFLELKDKGLFIYCRSSNPGAKEFQDLLVENEPLYMHVAKHVATGWNGRGNCGLVVGATYPEELKQIRDVVGDMPILIPGIGTQGGDLEKTIAAGKNSVGAGMIISSSRVILYARSDKNFAEAARNKAQELDSAIRKAL